MVAAVRLRHRTPGSLGVFGPNWGGLGGRTPFGLPLGGTKERYVDGGESPCGGQGEGVGQGTQRPMSPDGFGEGQGPGKWVQGDRPSFALGREQYQGGKWIEITYGRPLQRGRDLFGSGANYGKAARRRGAELSGAACVARRCERDDEAQDRSSPRLRQQDCPRRGGQFVHRSGEANRVDVDRLRLARSDEVRSKRQGRTMGRDGYTPDKDVARVPMKVETLPFAVDQLTWTFLDMTNDGGRIALMWGKTLASAPFKAGS